MNYQYEVVVTRRHESHGKSFVAVQQIGVFQGSSYETVKWLKDLIKMLQKEPYMAPRFEGEEPLPGFEEVENDQ